MSTKDMTTQPTKKRHRGPDKPGSRGITDKPKLLAKMRADGWTETTKTCVNNTKSSGSVTKVFHVAPLRLASGRKKGEGKQYPSLLEAARKHYPEFLTDEQKRKDAARATPAHKKEGAVLKLPDDFATTSQLKDVAQLVDKMRNDGWTSRKHPSTGYSEFFMSEAFAKAHSRGSTKHERRVSSLKIVAWYFYRGDHILSIDDVEEDPYKNFSSLDDAIKACVAKMEKAFTEAAFTEAGGNEDFQVVRAVLEVGPVDHHYLKALEKRLHPNEEDAWIDARIKQIATRARKITARSFSGQVAGGESSFAREAREVAERIAAAEEKYGLEVYDDHKLAQVAYKIENERNFLYTKTGDERFKDLSFLEILEKYGDNLCIYIGTRGFYKGSTKDERQFREEPFGQLAPRQIIGGSKPPIIMGQNCGSVFTNAEPGASATIAQLRDVVDGPKFRVAVLHTHHVKLNVRNIETLLHSRHHHRGLPGRLWRHIGAGASGFDKKTDTFDVGHHEVFLTYSFKLKQMVEDGVFAVAA